MIQDYKENNNGEITEKVKVYIPPKTALKKSGLYYQDELVMSWEELETNNYLWYATVKIEDNGWDVYTYVEYSRGAGDYFAYIATVDASNNAKALSIDYDQLIIDASVTKMSNNLF